MATVYFKDVSWPIKLSVVIGCAAAIVWAISIVVILGSILIEALS